MRAALLAASMAVFMPVLALAQTTPSAASPTWKPARGGDISRSDYIERAVERARKSAATRFDRMDANHDGILTADERRAARTARRNAHFEAQ